MSASNTIFSRDELLASTLEFHVQERSVRLQDVDAATTVFFPRIIEYFADVYLECMEREVSLDFPGMLRDRVHAVPLVHAEADFLRPMFYGDQIRVAIVAARVGGSSVSYGYRIIGADGVVRSVGQTTHVWVDGKSFRPCGVPDKLRDFLTVRGATTSSR